MVIKALMQSRGMYHPEEVPFAVMSGLLYIILLITWLELLYTRKEETMLR